MSVASKPAPSSLAAELVELLRTLTQGLFGTYRPERHYMRGPGPRWRAKHATPALALIRR
jgi:hypothetical protein